MGFPRHEYEVLLLFPSAGDIQHWYDLREGKGGLIPAFRSLQIVGRLLIQETYDTSEKSTYYRYLFVCFFCKINYIVDTI